GPLRTTNDLRSRDSCHPTTCAAKRRKRSQRPLPNTPRRPRPRTPGPLDNTDVLQRDEWLVGRGYLSAESISLCLAEPEKSSMKQINKEMPELQAARAAGVFRHIPGA